MYKEFVNMHSKNIRRENAGGIFCFVFLKGGKLRYRNRAKRGLDEEEAACFIPPVLRATHCPKPWRCHDEHNRQAHEGEAQFLQGDKQATKLTVTGCDNVMKETVS